MEEWFYSTAGQQRGPVSFAELQRLAATAMLGASDFVWKQGMAQWARAGEQAGLFQQASSAPIPMPPPLPPGMRVSPAQMTLSYRTPPPVRALGDDAGTRWLIPVGRSGLAIAAGYLGLFSLLGCVAPISIIVSILAIRDLRRHPHKHGMGRAVFGLVAGLLGTIGLLLVIIGSAM